MRWTFTAGLRSDTRVPCRSKSPARDSDSRTETPLPTYLGLYALTHTTHARGSRVPRTHTVLTVLTVKKTVDGHGCAAFIVCVKSSLISTSSQAAVASLPLLRASCAAERQSRSEVCNWAVSVGPSGSISSHRSASLCPFQAALTTAPCPAWLMCEKSMPLLYSQRHVPLSQQRQAHGALSVTARPAACRRGCVERR